MSNIAQLPNVDSQILSLYYTFMKIRETLYDIYITKNKDVLEYIHTVDSIQDILNIILASDIKVLPKHLEDLQKLLNQYESLITKQFSSSKLKIYFGSRKDLDALDEQVPLSPLTID